MPTTTPHSIIKDVLSVELGGTSESSRDQTGLFKPRFGWVQELDEARASAKKYLNREDPLPYARIARAYFMLRQFPKCLAAVKIALALKRKAQPIRRVLKQMQKECQKQANVKTLKDNQNMQAGLLEDKWNIDQSVFRHDPFKNASALQYAGLEGDTLYMEALIARGASLDLPFFDLGRPEDNVAPTDATLLVMLCAALALGIPSVMRNCPWLDWSDTVEHLDDQEECAIQLVRLGANCDNKLNLPQTQSPHLEIAVMQGHRPEITSLNLHGLTARELANISERADLIQAMRDMETKEDFINNAHCRCGSRLPWIQCHGNDRTNRRNIMPHYTENPEGKVLFLCSPLAKCPCGHTHKPYYKCCWEETVKPHYLDDSDGLLAEKMRTHNESMMHFMSCIARYHEDNGIPLGVSLYSFFPGAPVTNMSNGEMRTAAATSIRNNPSILPTLCGCLPGDRPTSLTTWDANVYAGCIERLEEDFFFWTDLHWAWEKSELPVRSKAWNAALDQYLHDHANEYADDDGVLLEAVRVKHTASIYAPCANPTCNEMEQTLKEFSLCTGCRRVAYCSRKCQKQHWVGGHKQQCQHA